MSAELRLVPRPGQGTDTPPTSERTRLIWSLAADLHELYFWQTNDRVRLDMDALRIVVGAALDDHSCRAVVTRADAGSEAARRGTPWVLTVFTGATHDQIPTGDLPLLLRALSVPGHASYAYFATHREAITAASARTTAARALGESR